jgi:hypothetical protein
MLIHPWDAALGRAEWRDWLASTGRFGTLAVSNIDPARAPLIVPTHFTVTGDELLIHLARPNPVWPHLEAATEVRLAVVGDYAYSAQLAVMCSPAATGCGPERRQRQHRRPRRRQRVAACGH